MRDEIKVRAKPFNLPAVPEILTADCFEGEPWQQYRDENIDLLLPKIQAATLPCQFTILDVSDFRGGRWYLLELLAAVLGEHPETPVEILSELLIERGHTLSASQIHTVVQLSRGGDVRQHLIPQAFIGGDYFYFMDVGDPKKPLMLGRFGSGIIDWHANVVPLYEATVRRHQDRSLILRNLDPSKIRI